MKSEILNKITNVDLSERVYRRLKKAITTRVFEPGERLNKNVLAEQLGVSYTPIKDAIVRLTAEGLITVKPKVGTFVTPFTREDMLELFQVRLILETGICSEIIQSISKEQMDILDENFVRSEEEMKKINADFDYFLYNELDAHFHETLIEASGNKKMLQIYKALNFHTQSARYFYNRYEEKTRKGQMQHKEVIDAIKKKDEALLRETLTNHIKEGQARVLREG